MTIACCVPRYKYAEDEESMRQKAIHGKLMKHDLAIFRYPPTLPPLGSLIVDMLK